MAVYTPVSFAQAQAWLEGFDLGALQAFAGIESGIENSNFFATTTRGRYVLTLFERLRPEQLPFYLGLMKHLSQRGIPCPEPIADRHGNLLGALNGRPAALVTRLAGQTVERPTPDQCAQVGRLLARMHLAARDYAGTQENLRGLAWCSTTAGRLGPLLDADRRAMLADELAAQQAFASSPVAHALARGPVHADLFRDNALFDGPRLGGVVDFYFAGVDTWVFDLAVTCNDWCIDLHSGRLETPLLQALLGGYREVRVPLPAEARAWPLMLRAAALRFWLSRLDDSLAPRPAESVQPKDPAHFERILQQRRTGVPPLVQG